MRAQLYGLDQPITAKLGRFNLRGINRKAKKITVLSEHVGRNVDDNNTRSGFFDA